jgi:DNA-binding transcriptional ArsR family regulator
MSRKDDELVWRALADPTRRAILDLLRPGPRTTGDVCDAFSSSRFAVMKHLGVLEAAGLVVTRRRGRQCWNAINAVPLRRLYDRWVSVWSDRTAASLLQLQSVAEATREGPSMQVRAIAIEDEVLIDADPAHVWKTMTQEIGRWWLHKFWENGVTFLELRAGGGLGERAGANEVLAATVTRVEPERRLSLRGSMGMSGAVAGVIDYTLESKDGGTLVKVSHHVVGEVDDETEASYTRGWHSLLRQGLKACCEGREVALTA